ncbi:MAG: alpha/beta hydrolase [Planctomycetaceae bacterium]|nr:alpha/beta hydrolase [Planctomycetaceae bacterium]
MTRLVLWGTLMGTVIAVIAFGVYWWWFQAESVRSEDIVYGQRDSKDLVLNVFQPPEPNGAGVILMVSGGWKSGPDSIRPFMFAPFVRRGYTVFAVQHLSQPECLIGNIVADVQRSVRFIRHHAADYHVNPDRLGVIGGSSGGHLSLMIGTCGDAGNPEAADPVERESSQVQCVACFYPPTDLLNLKGSTEDTGDGGPPRSFKRGFGPLAQEMSSWKKLGRELSPIYHITPMMPPTMIVHGDADTLVPIDQSERFVKEAGQHNCNVRFEIRPGKGHGWPTMVLDIIAFADWFDAHLMSEE